MAQQNILPKSIDPTKQLVNQEPPVWVQALALLANAPGAGWLGQDLSYINRGYALGQLRTARDAARLGYQAQQGQQNPFQLATTPETVEAKRGPFGLFGTKERAPTDQEKAIIQAGAQIAQAQQIKTMKEGAAYLKSIQGMHDAKVKQLMEFFQRTHDAATVETMAKQMGIADEMAPVIQGLYSRQAEMKKTEEQKTRAAAQEEKERTLRIGKLEREAVGGLTPSQQRAEERAFRGGEKQAIGEEFGSFIMQANKQRDQIDKLLADPEKAKATGLTDEDLAYYSQRRGLLQLAINQAIQRRAQAKALLSLPPEQRALHTKTIPTLSKGAYGLLKTPVPPSKSKVEGHLNWKGITKGDETPQEPSPGEYFMGEAGKAGRGIESGLSALYQLLFPEPAGGMTPTPQAPQTMTPVPPGSPGALPSIMPYLQNFGGM